MPINFLEAVVSTDKLLKMCSSWQEKLGSAPAFFGSKLRVYYE